MVYIRNRDRNIPPEEFMKVKRNPIYIVLDNLRSAYNVGSLIRTADAVRAEEVITCGITPHPPHPKLEKTSMESHRSVKITHFAEIDDAIEYLVKKKVFIVVMETTDESVYYRDADFGFPVAIVLGNEALGVNRKWFDVADIIVELPMMGYKNSLNVAVSGGIISYEILDRYLLTKIRKEK